MSASGRGSPHGWALTPLFLALALVAAGGPVGQVRAQADRPADWTLTGLREPVSRLFTPDSGGFFALTRDQLLRSHDAGATWTPLPLPFVAPGPRGLRAAVDPTNHDVLYVGSGDGLFRSVDAGGTWSRLSIPPPATPWPSEAPDRIVVSAADPEVVYLAVTANEAISARFRFLRSRDGGATWDALEEANNSLCGWGVRILQAHPTDPRRVLRTASCYAGRNLSDALRESRDQAATWRILYEPRLAFPTALVGGQGTAPGRWYLAANHDARSGGSTLFRSDDDGGTWQSVLVFQGGGTIGGADSPNVQMGGLAYDPAAPERLFVGLNETSSQAATPPPARSRVTTSADGGQTWTDLGRPDLGAINALAVGIDGRNLYAATEQGLWRLGWP
jgi:photosystem II stability/assembly factor-like uncharacterized protein